MAGPKPAALPLGDTPIRALYQSLSILTDVSWALSRETRDPHPVASVRHPVGTDVENLQTLKTIHDRLTDDDIATVFQRGLGRGLGLWALS
jgi:hypothetical protein